MTIKIKAQTLWLDKAWLTEYVGKRLDKRDKKYRIIRESDWRKLMRLVKAADEHYHSDPREICAICYPLATLKEKGK